MWSRALPIAAVASLAVAVGASAGWYRARSTLEASWAQMTESTLRPTLGLLQENLRIIHALQEQPYPEKDSGILESYLIKIRRDGVARNARYKEELDDLIDNNTAIEALLGAYPRHAGSVAFAGEVR